MKANRPIVMSTQPEDIRRRQCRVAAEVVFNHWSKPAQFKVAISAGHDESCFAVTVLRRNSPEGSVRRKCGEDAYAGRVAAKYLVRERIDMVVRNGHTHPKVSVPFRPPPAHINSQQIRVGRCGRLRPLCAKDRPERPPLKLSTLSVKHRSRSVRENI